MTVWFFDQGLIFKPLIEIIKLWSLVFLEVVEEFEGWESNIQNIRVAYAILASSSLLS